MMNPRPISMRKKVQLLVAITLLAWATQTLFQQWGFGGLIMPQGTPPEPQRASITLELSSHVETTRTDVTVRDLCRWSQQDDIAMEPLADIVLVRMSDANGVRPVAVNDIRAALRDAGANLINVKFTGAARCAVTKGDVGVEEIAKAMAQVEEVAPATQPTDEAAAPVVADVPQASLREMLVSGLVEKLSLPADRVQIEFSADDQATLAMTSPKNAFEIDASGATALGDVAWLIKVKTDGDERQVAVAAKVKAWEEQLVLTRNLSRGQRIITSDITSRRELVEKPSEDPVFEREQLVGQITARDMKKGDVFIAADAASPAVVMAGQFMTVTLQVRGAKIDTVARAMDDGAANRIVRAKNEATGEIYQVRVTGPDAGEVTATSQNVATINTGL